jgi:hypothetical protein
VNDRKAPNGTTRQMLAARGTMTRRNARGALSSVAAAVVGAAGFASAEGNSKTSDRKRSRPASSASTVTGQDHPLVSTASGPVRGYERGGIFTFKGIPYAEPTSRENRFMPPIKIKPWTRAKLVAVRAGLSTAARTGWTNDEEAFMFRWDDGQPGASSNDTRSCRTSRTASSRNSNVNLLLVPFILVSPSFYD